MRLVIALGGNALLRRGEPPTAAGQRANVARAAAVVARLALGHEVLVTHGNGPQVGLLALRDLAPADGSESPLDVLDAQTEGWIGYLIEEALAPLVGDRPVATLLTRVEVDPDDPAFGTPTKPIGPVYDSAAAAAAATEHHWTVGPDGDGWRRLVPSPEPVRVVELATIELLVSRGVLVVAAGGGGIPVVTDRVGQRGVEAVIDKDLSTSLLAVQLDADRLVLLTDADGVYRGWGAPGATRVARATPAELRALALDEGSMGPKVEAACRFVEATGRPAHIGGLGAPDGLLAGTTGTTVTAA